MKFILIISCLALLTFCSSSSKTQTSSNGGDSVKIERGVIVFSSLRMDYFFPALESSLITKSNYKRLQYKKGFLLSNLGPDSRIDLLRNFSDTLIDKRNYPLTNAVPVIIEYYDKEENSTASADTLCFKLSDNENCLPFDTRLRFIRKVTPIQ